MNALSTIEQAVVATHSHVARVLHPSSDLRPLAQAELLTLVDTLSNAYRDGTSPKVTRRLTRLESAGQPRTTSDRFAEERRFRCLLSTPTIEAWLIAWGRSTLLELHDHGGSSGAVRVLEGQLEESYTDLSSGHSLSTRRFGVGESFSFGPDHVHELGNPLSFPAISLHVYSPRLTMMDFYGSAGAAFLRPLRREYQ